MSRKNHQPRISRLFSAVDMAQGFIPFSAERADFYKKTGCWEDETHIQLLDRIRQQYGDKVAAIQGEKSLTYAQLYQYAAQYASYLQQQGIQAEDFIVIQSPNVIEFFIVLFALYYIGARPVFCLNGHGAYEIENIAMTNFKCNHVIHKYLIVDRTRPGIAGAVRQPRWTDVQKACWTSHVGHQVLDTKC